MGAMREEDGNAAGMVSQEMGQKRRGNEGTADPSLTEFLDEGRVCGVRGYHAAKERILTLRRMVALADFCAANPKRWETLKTHYFRADLSVHELAAVLKRSVKQVRRDLQPVILDEDVYSSVTTKEFSD